MMKRSSFPLCSQIVCSVDVLACASQVVCMLTATGYSMSSSSPFRLLAFAYRPTACSSSYSSSVVGSGNSSSSTTSLSPFPLILIIPGVITLSSPPEYVNPLNSSWILLVNGLPAASFFFFVKIWMLCGLLVLVGGSPEELKGPRSVAAAVLSLPNGPFGVWASPGPPIDCDTQSSEGSSSSKSMASNPTSRTSAEVNSGSKLAVDSSDSTTGLKGGVTCLSKSAFQSMQLKKGCSLSSAVSLNAPSRCLGFRLSNYNEVLGRI